MTEQVKHEGGCLCGAVRFEVTGAPMDVGYCHCRMCQKALGAPFGVFAIVAHKDFRFTRGEPAFYRSSVAKERSHCPTCGSPLTMWNADKAIRRHAGILLGTFDHPENFPPENHSGIESMVPWFHIEDGLPRWRTEDDPSYVPGGGEG